MDRLILVLYILMALKIAGVFLYALFIVIKENYQDMLWSDPEEVKKSLSR